MISVKESCFYTKNPRFLYGKRGVLFCRASVENIDGAVALTEGTGIVVESNHRSSFVPLMALPVSEATAMPYSR